jgi:DNA polymerase-1
MNVRQSDLQTVISKLSAHASLGLDTETTGLLWSDRLFNLIISTNDEEFVFWFGGKDVPQELLLPKAETFTSLARLFSCEYREWFIQNAKFDLRMLCHEGARIAGRIYCTNAQGRLFKNNRLGKKPYSLAMQSRDYLGQEKDNKAEKYIKENKLKTLVAMPGKGTQYEVHHYDKIPFNIMADYAARDGRLHYDLGMYLKKNMPTSIQPLSLVEQKVTKVLLDMEILGIKINRDYTRSAMIYEESLLLEAKTSFLAQTGYEYANDKKLLCKIFESEGAKIPTTAKGNPSLTDDTLEEIDSPAAEAVRLIRGIEKRISTYYSSFLFFADRNDIIHADFRQGGTETGRLSCGDPNLQNLPAEDEDEDKKKPFWVRGCFQPRPGMMFSSVDFKQQEFRMLAAYAGETELIKKIMEGADVHQATADLVGITRKQAKTLNFALIYGMGVAKLARALNISLAEAKVLRQRYFARFPKIESFLLLVADTGQKRGFVRTWAGRRQHLFSPEYSYILPNHLIQGGCADVLKYSMAKIGEHSGIKEVPMVVNIHDELIFEHKPEHIDIIKDYRGIMESVFPQKNGMILHTDHSISYTSLAKLDMEKYV